MGSEGGRGQEIIIYIFQKLSSNHIHALDVVPTNVKLNRRVCSITELRKMPSIDYEEPNMQPEMRSGNGRENGSGSGCRWVWSGICLRQPFAYSSCVKINTDILRFHLHRNLIFIERKRSTNRLKQFGETETAVTTEHIMSTILMKRSYGLERHDLPTISLAINVSDKSLYPFLLIGLVSGLFHNPWSWQGSSTVRVKRSVSSITVEFVRETKQRSKTIPRWVHDLVYIFKSVEARYIKRKRRVGKFYGVGFFGG